MGFSKKNQGDGGTECEGKKWVIAGISIRSSLKPIKTKPKPKPVNCDGGREEEEERYISTTPTSREAKIPEILPCPPAPRKRRPASRCHLRGARDFFTPPDLETVFKCHV